MEKRKLGTFEVSPLGLGCMGITHASGAPMAQADGVKVIQAAFDMGYTFFDTAECYTGVYPDGSTAYNEDVVGEALKPIRGKVVLATKCGVTHGGDRLILDSRPETIRKSVEGSLKRLGTDYIDLYYQHRIDPNVPAEDVAGAMADLIKEGKIRAWGISEVNEDYLRKAHAVCPVTAIQNRYSMLARWHESLFPVCEELGITYVAFSPLGNGFLSGRYSGNSTFEKNADFRKNMPQYTEEGMKQGQPLLDLLHRLSEEKSVTPAQISLAWMLHKKPFIVPIPGSRKMERLKENLFSADVLLTADEMKEIDSLLSQIDVPVFGGHS